MKLRPICRHLPVSNEGVEVTLAMKTRQLAFDLFRSVTEWKHNTEFSSHFHVGVPRVFYMHHGISLVRL
jgi:hypothetical protein